MFNRIRAAIDLKIFLFIMVMLIPRQFGLLAVKANVKGRRLARSRLWQLYSILCIGCFVIVYPLAMREILLNQKILSEKDIYHTVEAITHVAVYFFSVFIYVLTLSWNSCDIKYTNLMFELLEKCRILCPTENSSILGFITRVFYSYFGYIILNIITSVAMMQSVPFCYIFIYFLPDIISAVTLVRIASMIALLDLSCFRISQAFTKCMKTEYNSSKKIASVRMGSKFIQIAEYHYKVYELTRNIEKLTTNLVIFSILNIFVQIVSMVNIRYSATNRKVY